MGGFLAAFFCALFGAFSARVRACAHKRDDRYIYLFLLYIYEIGEVRKGKSQVNEREREKTDRQTDRQTDRGRKEGRKEISKMEMMMM